MPFTDRAQAGRRLAVRLSQLRGTDTVVLALPRGGVPVGYEVARVLAAPLDVLIVRKLGLPFQPELAMGAIGEDGARVLNPEILHATGVSAGEVAAVELAERAELRRRLLRFRAGRPRVRIAGRTAIVVDDGIATGATARAACLVARAQGAARVVLAAPVAPADVAADLAAVADEVVFLATPQRLTSVGAWYQDFAQTPDEEVVGLLDLVATGRTAPGAETSGTGAGDGERRNPPANPVEVEVPALPAGLAGRLLMPESATGLVIVAHSGSSDRHSPRSRHLAGELFRNGLGTLAFDLLTPAEETDRRNVFDVPLLGERLVHVIDWLSGQPEGKAAPIGLFGAGTGAAAALWAAADIDTDVAAVVSRGGRPDLAGDRLAVVRAPTLLLVGGHDHVVFDLNRTAMKKLRCPHRLVVVPAAGHLFGEPGSLRTATGLAREWFAQHLRERAPAAA